MTRFYNKEVISLRAPSQVMRLARLGAFFPTRLSFNRRLLRRLRAAGAKITRDTWTLDRWGYGRAIYRLEVDGDVYSLCCFSHPLAASERTDRVIAQAWDATFVLTTGIPDPGEIERLAQATPRQESARYRSNDLVLARANRSVRAFEHAVTRLASGQQPDPEILGRVGYLMRTTAVYGNGKFGIADRAHIAAHPLLGAPFQAELLTVYLIREFTVDLVEHIAAERSPGTSTHLAPPIRRSIGVGNATGLGMAPFLVNHPILLHRWIAAREQALARVRVMASPTLAQVAQVRRLLARARAHVAQWSVDDEPQRERLVTLERELSLVSRHADTLAPTQPWEALYTASERYSVETQECLIAILLEPYGELVDDLAEEMAAQRAPSLDPTMTVAQLREIANDVYAWTLAHDFSHPDAQARFWYVSEEKLEPRLGERFEEPGAERELPLGIARDARALIDALARAPSTGSLAHWLLAHPEHRAMAHRAQMMARYPYGEIQDNLLGRDCRPIDMLRCKLSFLGATKFDPRSELWTRVTFYQGAPAASELNEHDYEQAFTILPEHWTDGGADAGPRPASVSTPDAGVCA